jgi:hypothetical protein
MSGYLDYEMKVILSVVKSLRYTLKNEKEIS